MNQYSASAAADRALRAAVVHYQWQLESMAPLQQINYGRRVTINPRSIKISTFRREGLYVYIEGRTIRRDGQPGATNRAVVFMDEPRDGEQDMSKLPIEYHPYLTAARQAEAARLEKR